MATSTSSSASTTSPAVSSTSSPVTRDEGGPVPPQDASMRTDAGTREISFQRDMNEPWPGRAWRLDLREVADTSVWSRVGAVTLHDQAEHTLQAATQRREAAQHACDEAQALLRPVAQQRLEQTRIDEIVARVRCDIAFLIRYAWESRDWQRSHPLADSRNYEFPDTTLIGQRARLRAEVEKLARVACQEWEALDRRSDALFEALRAMPEERPEARRSLLLQAVSAVPSECSEAATRMGRIMGVLYAWPSR